MYRQQVMQILHLGNLSQQLVVIVLQLGCGTFWQWYNFPGLATGNTLSGFSFTAPSSSSSNNYGVYASGYIEYGYIIAPDVDLSALPIVPEPISSILFLTGGAVLAGKRYQRIKGTV
jgi:hypothetical protein